MTGFGPARQLALRMLGGHHLAQAQWVAIAQRCAAILRAARIESPMVAGADAVAALLRNLEESAESELLDALQQPTPGRLDLEAVQQLHATLLYATHATRAADDVGQRLLANVEREFLGGPRRQPLEAVMLRWRNQVATHSQPVTPASAHAISTVQYFLLSMAQDLVQRAELQGGAGKERLITQIGAAARSWGTLRSHLKKANPAPAIPPSPRLLDTQRALMTAMSHVGESERLAALLSTGFAGNLAATRLIMSSVGTAFRLEPALELDSHSDLLAHQPVQVTPRPASPPPPPTPNVPSGIQMASGPGTPIAPVAHTEAPVTFVDPLDQEGHNALGRVMQAGIIATAALQGDPAAKEITKAATTQELEHIARAGDAARNGLVAAILPKLEGIILRDGVIHRHRVDDMVQQIGVNLLRDASRWDPEGGMSWFSWAHLTMRGTISSEFRTYTSRKEKAPMVELSDVFQNVIAEHAPGPEAQTVQRAEIAGLLAAIDQLPPDQQRVLRLAIQNTLQSGHEKHREIGERLNVSDTTVSRRLEAARTKLAHLTPQQHRSTTRPEHRTRTQPPGPRI